ncbi:hypothetical protein [Bacteroides nordii]
MRQIIFKKEDPENEREYSTEEKELSIDEFLTFSCKLAQMPIRDLAILNFITESEMKRFYIGQSTDIDYGTVELLLNVRCAIDETRHYISSFNDALYLQYYYLPTNIPLAKDSDLLPIIIVNDILNISESDLKTMAMKDNELYSDEDDNCFVPLQWVVDLYNSSLESLGLSGEIHIQNNGIGRIEILIERDLE